MRLLLILIASVFLGSGVVYGQDALVAEQKTALMKECQGKSFGVDAAECSKVVDVLVTAFDKKANETCAKALDAADKTACRKQVLGKLQQTAKQVTQQAHAACASEDAAGYPVCMAPRVTKAIEEAAAQAGDNVWIAPPAKPTNGPNAVPTCFEAKQKGDLGFYLPTTLIPHEENHSCYGYLTGGEIAQKFKNGNFELYDIPSYVIYLIEMLIFYAGLLAVLFVVYGGYKYFIGALEGDKTAGKSVIVNALLGFAVAVLAWTIVNVVQVWVTSGEDRGATERPDTLELDDGGRTDTDTHASAPNEEQVQVFDRVCAREHADAALRAAPDHAAAAEVVLPQCTKKVPRSEAEASADMVIMGAGAAAGAAPAAVGAPASKPAAATPAAPAATPTPAAPAATPYAPRRTTTDA